MTDQINEVKSTFTEPIKEVTGTFSDLKSSVDIKSAIEAPVAAKDATVAGAAAGAALASVPESPAPAAAPSRHRRGGLEPRRRSRRRRCPPTARRRPAVPDAPGSTPADDVATDPPASPDDVVVSRTARVPRHGGLTRWRFAEDRLTLLERLDELRKRLFVCLIAATVSILVAALFNSFMFEALLYPLRQVADLPESATEIATFSPAEPFMVSLGGGSSAGSSSPRR